MRELIFQQFYFVLELMQRRHEELVNVVQNYDYFAAGQFLDHRVVEGEVYIGDLVELVSEHIPVLDPEKVDKMVNMEYLSLQQICGRFYCEGGLAYPWLPIQEEGIILVIL